MTSTTLTTTKASTTEGARCNGVRQGTVLSSVTATAEASTPPAGTSHDESDYPMLQPAGRLVNATVVTELRTRTVTITRSAHPATATHEMTTGTKQYRLQGCLQGGGEGEGGDPVGGQVLGPNRTVPTLATGVGTSNDMTLSLCLGLCAASAETHSLVGLSDGA